MLYNVKPGTPTDTRVRLRGKGVPTLRNKDVRGDHYVTLVVQVPTSLTAEQKELIEKLDATFPDPAAAGSDKAKDTGKGKKKKFSEKLNDLFE